MEQTNTKKTVQTNDLGNTKVVQEQVTTGNPTDNTEFSIEKSSQVIWFLGHFIAILLALRFIFLLLGARITGIVLIIYNLTAVLVAPFKGIFPSAQTGVSFFDSSSLIAIVMYYLLIALITKIISLFSKKTAD